MTNWTLRKARPEDAEMLAACIEQAYSVHAEKGIDLPPVSDGVEDDIRNNVVWVAVDQTEIVGGLILSLQSDRAILSNVAVAPSATGLGLGRALIDHAEQEVRRLGLTRMSLTTHVDIPDNVRLYERLGWHETGRIGNKVHMEKSLTG